MAWLRSGRPKKRVSTPSMDKRFLFPSRGPDRFSVSISYYIGNWSFFLGLKRREREVDHSPPSNSEWIELYPVSSKLRHGVQRDSFTFFYPHSAVLVIIPTVSYILVQFIQGRANSSSFITYLVMNKFIIVIT